MLNGPTREDLVDLQRAANANDPPRTAAVFAAICARLGSSPSWDQPWAMQLVADGCTVGLARLAGEEHFRRAPIHAETIAEAHAVASEVAA